MKLLNTILGTANTLEVGEITIIAIVCIAILATSIIGIVYLMKNKNKDK